MQRLALEQYLSPEQITELRLMATRSHGWTFLLRLLNSLEAQAQKQLQLFKNSNDAFERRGYANAITMLHDVLRTLYDDRSDHIGQEQLTAQRNSIIEGAQNDSTSEGGPAY